MYVADNLAKVKGCSLYFVLPLLESYMLLSLPISHCHNFTNSLTPGLLIYLMSYSVLIRCSCAKQTHTQTQSLAYCNADTSFLCLNIFFNIATLHPLLLLNMRLWTLSSSFTNYSGIKPFFTRCIDIIITA